MFAWTSTRLSIITILFQVSKPFSFLSSATVTPHKRISISHLHSLSSSNSYIPMTISMIQSEVHIKSEVLDNSIKQELIWEDLNVKPSEFRPNLTLRMGQCFHWKKLEHSAGEISSNNDDQSLYFEDSGVWVGVVDGNAIAIRQTRSTSYYSNLTPNVCNTHNTHNLLHEYFQLKYSLEDLYNQWSKSCPRMNVICSKLPGVRVIRQDPWECLVSFICSSCNNIKRITQMLDSLRKTYGIYLCSVQILSDGRLDYRIDSSLIHNTSYHHLYSFPEPSTIAKIPEDDLRRLGFGYRAKFLVNTAKLLESKSNGAKEWLFHLRSLGNKKQVDNNDKVDITDDLSGGNVITVSEMLMECPGVGRKVADCVSLFSLDQASSVPVDTHVWEIAIRDYAPHLQLSKSLTPKIYNEVGDVFREKFGSKAGWAHSVLFAGELPEFRRLLPINDQVSMKEFSDERKRKRQEKKQNKVSIVKKVKSKADSS